MAGNPWIAHLKSFYAKNKSKMSYAQAMKAAKSSYTKKGSGKAAKGSKGKKKVKFAKDDDDEAEQLLGGAILPGKVSFMDIEPKGKISLDKILKDAAMLSPAPFMPSLIHGIVDMIPRNMIAWNQMTSTYHATSEEELHNSLTKLTSGRGAKYDHPRVARTIFESFKHSPELTKLYHNT